MSRDFELVVAGAGVVGSVMAALAIAQKVTQPGAVAILAERPPGPGPGVGLATLGVGGDGPGVGWDTRVFALSRASQRVLRAAGAWELIPPSRTHAYERMCVWDAQGEPGGTGSLRFDCAEVGEPDLGLIVEGRALQAACVEAARAAGAVFIESAPRAIAAADDGWRVSVRDGREFGAHLLIGADGIDSAVRELLGIETAGHAYYQDALVAQVRTARAHGNTAYQRFLPGGPLAFLPLPAGRSSIVWSVDHAQAMRLQALDAEAFGSALDEASAQVLGRCTLDSEVLSFPLKLQSAVDYVRPRAVLIGDAAHVVHPLAGQGLNLGLLDCAALCEVLNAGAGAGVGAGAGGGQRAGGGGPGRRTAFGDHRLLRRYERWRRTENELAAAALDGLQRMFSATHPAAAWLRRTGLSAVDRLPGLKRELALRALGLRGDVPALVRDGRR